MTRFSLKAALVAVAAGILFAASPAFAYEWQCTAKNVRGATYTRSAAGVNSAVVHNRARDKALAACHRDSGAPLSCAIIACSRV